MGEGEIQISETVQSPARIAKPKSKIHNFEQWSHTCFMKPGPGSKIH